jgi:hypothetical protein
MGDMEDLARRLNPDMAEECVRALRSQGIESLTSLCFVTETDIKGEFSGPLCSALLGMLSECKGLAAGASLLTVRCAKLATVPAAEAPQVSQPSSRTTGTLSRSSLSASSSFSSFTCSFMFGSKRRRPASSSPAVLTAESREQALMEDAKLIVEKVFLEFASTTPRFLTLKGASPLMWDMQRDVYRLGSKSHRVVRRRANMVRSFFVDIRAYSWDIGCLTPFEVAAWVRGRVSGGTPSAVASARQVLRLVEASTDCSLHLSHPLVKGQLQAGATSGKLPDEPEMAKEVDINIIMKMEELSMSADSPALRCVAGFFALLACSSLRASDALRTRSIRLTADAISGVSRMKGKRCWTRWFADRHGFSGSMWAEHWLKNLKEFANPGPDFLMCAPSASLDGFLERPAEYGDMRRSLHVVLMILGMNAQSAVEYNPHGFRHVLVSVGQQLRSLGIVEEGELERIGHWTKGSNMPRKYDSCAGVSELKVRETLMRAIRNGWRPAPEGCLPASASGFLVPRVPDPVGVGGVAGVPDTSRHPCGRSVPDLAPVGVPDPASVVPADVVPDPRPENPCSVGHSKRLKLHRTMGTGVSLCKMWRCGTVSEPAAAADFTDSCLSLKKCVNCWR